MTSYTAPPTKTPPTPTLAADWNTYIRDNEGVLRANALSGLGELIETLSPSASTGITTATLPVTYSHLAIRGYGLVASTAANFTITFNGDTGTNYGYTIQGRTTGGGVNDNDVAIGSAAGIVVGVSSFLPAANNHAATFTFEILSYRSTTYNKNLFGIGVGRTGANVLTTFNITGVWAPATPAAITSITFTPSTGNMTGTICIYGMND